MLVIQLKLMILTLHKLAPVLHLVLASASRSNVIILTKETSFETPIIAFVGPVEYFKAVHVVICDYEITQKSREVRIPQLETYSATKVHTEKNILRVIAEMENFKVLEVKARKIPRSEWESKYSTEVYNALVSITGRANSKENESPYTPYIATSQEASDVTPATNDSAKLKGTSTPKKPSAPLQKTSAQPAAAASTSRSVPLRADLAHRTRRGSSTVSSAPNPRKTEDRGSRGTPHQGSLGSSRQDAKKTLS